MEMLGPIAIHYAETNDGRGEVGDAEDIVAGEIANTGRNKDFTSGVGNIGNVNQAVGGGIGSGAAVQPDELTN
jgi:hypothetical protein